MIERLIEVWIDSASERSYQAVFCQILAATGHRILHSTRHRPLELGKDVVSVAPDKRVCTYQLKGNPGGYLTLGAFQEIQQQLVTMIAVPPIINGRAAVAYRAYLVTNGRVDEDAQEAIAKLDAACRGRQYAAQSLEVIARDELLAHAVTLGATLWPSETEDEDLLMQLLVSEGRGPFPAKLGDALLGRVLGFDALKLSKRDTNRRATSASLLSAIALRRFSAQCNYASEIHGWVMFYAMAAGAYEARRTKPNRSGAQALNVAELSIHDSLARLTNEAQVKGHTSEGNAFADFAFIRIRRTHVAALVSVLWLWNEGNGPEGWGDSRMRKFASQYILGSLGKLSLWGEAAIVQIAAITFALMRMNEQSKAEGLLSRALLDLIAANANKTRNESASLSSPYYDAESVVRSREQLLFPESQNRPAETFAGNAWLAEAMLFILVRLNNKQMVRRLWPDYTRLRKHVFVPASAGAFVRWRGDRGAHYDIEVEPKGSWAKLRMEASDTRVTGLPPLLAEKPLLLLLFLIYYPHRANTATFTFLDSKLRGDPL